MLAVRRAGPGDLEAVAGLFLAYLDFYHERPPVALARRYLASHLEAGTATVFLATAAGRAVGFALVYPTWDSLELSRRWVLHDLFVAPDARRAGAGRALLDACVDLARSTGASSVTLDTARDNLPARALYEAAGFVRDDVFVTYHHELG